MENFRAPDPPTISTLIPANFAIPRPRSRYSLPVVRSMNVKSPVLPGARLTHPLSVIDFAPSVFGAAGSCTIATLWIARSAPPTMPRTVVAMARM
jgi:hypothetical protein